MTGSIVNLLNEYGTWLVFANVLLVQLGLPIPAVPGLVLAGGLAAAGRLDPFLVVAAAVMASTLADYGWYLAGRRLGYAVLHALFRLFLSPDFCVRQAETRFERWGPGMLLFAKFIPGGALITPSLAGVMHMPPPAFLLCASMGALLWAATFVALGYTLDAKVHVIVEVLERYSGYLLLGGMALGACLLARLARCRAKGVDGRE